MPASPDKPTNAPAAENTDFLYLTVNQRPDGRIDSITATNTQPDAEDTWFSNIHATVWAMLLPEHEEDTSYPGKVLDLSLGADYLHEGRAQWAEGERQAATFHTHNSRERTTLRRTEAEIIRAGHLDVHTSTVGCQSYGLTITNGSEEFHAYQVLESDWFMSMRTWYANDGWTAVPGIIAPASASPRAVAAAILSHVYDGTETRGELRPLARARVAYLQWRRTPNWKNFKYRARQRFNRYRHRVTVRLPRD
ncbi:hypothetical protein [Streptomyces chrestomyceticus]|uniref:hypothetical protein n=1 Tax=Streptomyces chrestomyceticus TaxID=68185 RepID=UPI00341150FB